MRDLSMPSGRGPIFLAIPVMALLLLAGCNGSDGPLRLGLGSPCAQYEDTDCISGLCLRIDSASAYCTQPCDREVQNCPDGFVCQRTANPSGDHCVVRGANCNDDVDCPAGHRCDTSPGPGLGVCYVPVSRGLCAPCNSDLQCPEGGGCLKTATGEEFCVTPCDGECPDGYTCTDLPGRGHQCVPERQTCDEGRPVCAPCRGHAECGGFLDLCVQNLASGERFCGIDCEGNPGVCPPNFSCLDLSGEGDGPHQCVPNAASCRGYCDAEPADISRAEAQCGFGRMCETDENTCVVADDGRLCAPCADDDDCRKVAGSDGNLCMANVHTGETFCGRPCGEDEAPCPLGFSCIEVEAFGEIHEQCVPTRASCQSGTGRLGDSCGSAGADDCLSGVCLDFGPIALCSGGCTTDEECSAGGANYQCCWLSEDRTEFDCSRGPEDLGVCAPYGGEFGDDCTPGRAPCRSGLCLDIGTARLCTLGCEVDENCPDNFVCQTGQSTNDDRGEIRMCFPAGGGEIGSDCTFGPAACASRLCITRGGMGSDICTVACGDGGACPDDWVCDPEALTVDNRQIAVCVPPVLAP
jgi:hypothetical protein